MGPRLGRWLGTGNGRKKGARRVVGVQRVWADSAVPILKALDGGLSRWQQHGVWSKGQIGSDGRSLSCKVNELRSDHPVPADKGSLDTLLAKSPCQQTALTIEPPEIHQVRLLRLDLFDRRTKILSV